MNLADIESLECSFNKQTAQHDEFIKEIHDYINTNKTISKKDVQIFLEKYKKKHKISCSNSSLIQSYRLLCQNNPTIDYDISIEKLLQSKTFRSQSGVIVIASCTSPYPHGQKFSCEYDCYFCPAEPDQPRSYLSNEPGVRRANRNYFDAIEQFNDRATTYISLGHTLDKIELLVLGGTWSSYPIDYQIEFIRDNFYAANTFYDIQPKRQKLSVEEEAKINETSKVRIIGVTVETRPDRINAKELRRYREKEFVTRIQMGIQHTNDRILYRVNRGHTNDDTKKAIKMLKDNCFKVDIHIMPDLPKPLKDGGIK